MMTIRGYFPMMLVTAVFVLLSACQTPVAATTGGSTAIGTSAAATPETQEADADPLVTVTRAPSPSAWRDAPVVPEELSDRAREIYTIGIELGRDPQVFSKVGDCGGTPSWFLGPFDIGPSDYRLGEYLELEGVIAYFQGSYGRESLAVHDGFNVASILSPIRANQELCESGENPLACEFRINNPSIALIMLGTNDVYHVDEFEGRMRQIIEYTIDQGVLPVLASKPDNLEGDHAINQILYRLAVEYEVPFWNLWRAFQDLPDKGLQVDKAHVTFAPNYFDDENVMKAGWPHRNLTALQVLDFLWQELGGE
jgi:hypothetical protein